MSRDDIPTLVPPPVTLESLVADVSELRRALVNVGALIVELEPKLAKLERLTRTIADLTGRVEVIESRAATGTGGP